MNAIRIRLIMPTFAIHLAIRRHCSIRHCDTKPQSFLRESAYHSRIFIVNITANRLIQLGKMHIYKFFLLIRTHVYPSIFLFLVSNHCKRSFFDIHYRICLRLSITEGDEIMEWLYDPPCVTKSGVSLHLENVLSYLHRFALIRDRSHATLINYMSTGSDVVLSPLA